MRLEENFARTLRRQDFHITVVLGGISNFITLTKERERDLSLLHYIKEEDRLRQIKSTITRFDQKYKGNIHIGLKGYFKAHNPDRRIPDDVQKQQEDLLTDIEDINLYITEINKKRGQESIDLDAKLIYRACIIEKRGNKRRNRSNRQTKKEDLLPDWVHSKTELEEKWFSRLFAVPKLL